VIRHDLSHWPLVISMGQGNSSLTEVETFHQEWNRWLAREEPFATLRLFVDMDSTVQPPGASVFVKQWLQIHSEAVRANVMGMAMVVCASEYPRFAKRNAEKLFGVPAAVFDELPAALDWLHERVYAPRGLRFDADAVAVSITAMCMPIPL